MYDGLLDLLGIEQEAPSACVPTELLLRRLAARVEAELPGVELRVREVELPDLTAEERGRAIDHIVAGSEYPYVFLDGEVRWTGSLDIDGVLASLAQVSAA